MKVWEERDLATETRRRCHVVQFNNFIRWFEWTWKSRHWTENNYFTQASFSSLTEKHRNTFLTLTNPKGTIIKISNLTLHWPLASKLATCFNESEGSFYKISCETTLCNVVNTCPCDWIPYVVLKVVTVCSFHEASSIVWTSCSTSVKNIRETTQKWSSVQTTYSLNAF